MPIFLTITLLCFGNEGLPQVSNIEVQVIKQNGPIKAEKNTRITMVLPRQTRTITWRGMAGPDPAGTTLALLPDFELRLVDDTQKGRCLEVELKPEGQVWEAMHEYVFLKLKKPVLVKGPVEYAGIWVKGNSGWGDIMWEIENAQGGKWFSQNVYMDWPGHIATNFDGWNFLRLQLPPGPMWRCQVKIIGLAVIVPRKMLYVTEMAPMQSLKIRLKGSSLFP